jgi:hypothetical protein
VALPRGETLTWTVTARLAGGNSLLVPSAPAPPALLEVASGAAAEEIAAARATGSHLLAGLALWRAGMVTEGAAELARLSDESPGSPFARALAKSSVAALATRERP